jgi:pilus assembly protein CpaF
MQTFPRSLAVIEDGGLAALGTQPSTQNVYLDDAATLQAVREALRDQIGAELLDPVAPAAVRDPEVLRVLRAEIGTQLERGYGPLRGLPTDECALLRLFHDAIGWGPAQPYLDDERVQELKIIGDRIMVQEEGSDFTLVPERFADARQVLDRALLLAARLNVPLDRTRPQDTLPLAHGTRMHVSIPPCTPEGSGLICIRRGRRHAWDLDDVLRRNACDDAVAALLQLFVRAGCSFLIAGETGCGKTALLEALINAWPGEPHVITIEDNALEINVRHSAWTRELVQSALEPGAFGRAAREVLRQTPTVVAPGETRAEEAGAILAVAVSGHAVVTTIHARSASRAVQRFADCAAMPGAYIYNGRRDHALEDACDNFQIVIHLEKVGGRRYINEILLLDGVIGGSEHPRPQLVRLAWAEQQDGELRWEKASVVAGDRLCWTGVERTPEGLARRLRLLSLRAAVRAAPSTRAAIDDSIERATIAVRAGDGAQALAILRRAWFDRPDERLVSAARHALELDHAQTAALSAEGRTLAETAHTALRARDWPTAGAAHARVRADLALFAAYTPRGGWAALAAELAAGIARDQRAEAAVTQANLALAQGRARDAVDLLATCSPDQLSPALARNLLAARRAALIALHQAGEIGAEALTPVEAEIAALQL